MFTITLNPHETNAAMGISCEAFTLYARSLKQKMNRWTGIVGGKERRICLRGLAEEMYKEPGRGIRGSGTPSKYRVRRWIEELARCGLIQIVSDAGYIVIQCLLADYAFKVSTGISENTANSLCGVKEAKETGTNIYPISAEAKSLEKPARMDEGKISESELFVLNNPKVAQPLNKINKNNYNPAEENLRTELDTNFVPNQETLATAQSLGLYHSEASLIKFKIYHNKNQSLYDNWQESYLHWLRIRQTYPVRSKSFRERTYQSFSKPHYRQHTSAIRHSQEFVTSAVNAMPFYSKQMNEADKEKFKTTQLAEITNKKIAKQESEFKALSKLEQSELLAKVGFKHVAEKLRNGALHD